MRAKSKAHHTFKAVAEEFLALKNKTLRPRSYPDVERHLLKHAKVLHGLQVGSITKGEISSCLNTVEKNSGEVTRNRVRTTLSTFFSWMIQEDYAVVNPVIGTRRSAERSRERVLSREEIRLIWHALPDDHFGAIMKLLAITGQREAEIAGLRRSELNDDPETIKLPGSRTKNKVEHWVPIPLAAQAIIAAQPQRASSSGELRDLFFGYGAGPFSGWSKSKADLDAAIAKANKGKKLLHWTPHDLRRTFATHMNELGIAPPHIVEAILNHISGHKRGVAGIYNRAQYLPEKRAALARWADQLSAWIEGRETNVTTLRRA